MRKKNSEMEKLIITSNSLMENGGLVAIGTENNRWLAETKGCHVNGSTNEDAIILACRLVAAYNACEGIPIEALESPKPMPLVFQDIQVAIEIERLKSVNAQLLEALARIFAWEMPETGKFWDEYKKEPMSYAACFGSNGERDIIKNIAFKAISAATKTEAP